MKEQLAIDAITLDAQLRASNPRASAWVSANAGSGKTHVLAQRVKRLLLAGASPDRILCLTFTKAAAANMATRIFDDLAQWAVMEKESLRATLAALENLPPAKIGEKQIRRARQVFAEALETPGGLKIQTIHAFCDALLHRFPFEAGLAGSFRVLDEQQHKILIAEAFSAVVSGKQNEELQNIFAHLRLARAPQELQDAVAACLPRLSSFNKTDLRAAVFHSLGLDPAFNETNLAAHIMQGISKESLLEILQALKAGNKDDVERADEFAAAFAETDDVKRAHSYLSVFCTKEGNMRARFPGKAVHERAPKIAVSLASELERLRPLREQYGLLEIAENSAALLVIAQAVHDEVERMKAARGLLDYADLIARAGNLLNSEGADWVRYKLDYGIDHILIDEAQDTSIAQWQVIKGLAQEFFVGEGSRRTLRTIFAVGDDKQSIFSFQGAVPQLFDSERSRVARETQDAALQFEDVRLNLSFRSSSAILRAVDAIFARTQAAAGVSADLFPPHQAAKTKLPGRVELWPLEMPLPRSDMEGWDHPFDAVSRQDPRIKLAERIADEIRRAIGSENVMDDAGPRPLQAGDVLVLVRTRNVLFDALIRALKTAGLPVAGADRLVLVEHIAAIDLIALADAVLLPEDDLNFAALLKSPLMGLEENDIFTLAHDRQRPLYRTLQMRADENVRWQAAAERFASWRERAKGCRPYEFFSKVLGADGGRKAFYSRLGREAGDVLDEFLNAALQFESIEIPTLQNFVSWLRKTRAEIKREFQQGQDEVRVMTVHNAKGLEAKWVVLADTVDMPGARQLDEFFNIDEMPLWAPGKKYEKGALVDARAKASTAQSEEYRRLFYVALTRAEERLIIAGAQQGREPAEVCWYALARDALVPLSKEERDRNGNIARWILQDGDLPAQEKIQANAAQIVLPPSWLERPPPSAPASRPQLVPSHVMAAELTIEGGNASVIARNRGTLLHSLLQHLPSLPAEQRSSAARRFLQSRAAGFLLDEQEALIEEALRVLAMPQMQPLLGAHALAEVSVASDIVLPSGKTVALNGQIDRLAILSDSLVLTDFKSGVAPSPHAWPENYISQLTLYREILKPIADGRVIKCQLLWTSVPRLDAIPDPVLDEMLAKIA